MLLTSAELTILMLVFRIVTTAVEVATVVVTALTMTVPVNALCIRSEYGYVPGVLNVNEYDPLGERYGELRTLAPFTRGLVTV